MELTTQNRTQNTSGTTDYMKVIGRISSLSPTEELVCSGVDNAKRLQRFILDIKKRAPSLKDVRTKIISKDKLIVFRQEPNEG